ncbi:MAG: hypothetical protein ABFC96_01530, partial [Thermoguttaceae bacterium]
MSRVAIVVVVFLLAVCSSSAADPTPLESARPMIGTGGFGHTYPGATAPFGMVQLSPDTRLDTWDGCSGYCHADRTILGFSHTHLSGTGCPDLGDIRLIPQNGPKGKIDADAYRPLGFSHADETARPGYYCVLAGDPKIKVELTATAHAGLHRCTFPAGRPAAIVFDLER